MKEILNNNIWPFYIYLIVGVLIFVIFRIAFEFLHLLKLKKSVYNKINKYLPFIELIFWFLFIIASMNRLLEHNQIIASGIYAFLLIAFIWFFWSFIRDIIAGLIIKYNDTFKLNENIKIKEYSGRVRSFSRRYLEIETELGEIVYIPYSSIPSSILVKSNPGEKIKAHTFSINVSNKYDLVKLVGEIKSFVLALPWASVIKKPLIIPNGNIDNCYKFEITIYSIEEVYLFQMEDKIRKRFSNENIDKNND